MQDNKDSMTPVERRASVGLAGIYGLRMLGLFIILPVFALYAEHLPGGDNKMLVGIALGAYGLTQAIRKTWPWASSDRSGPTAPPATLLSTPEKLSARFR